MKNDTYLSRLLRALLGQPEPAASVPPAPAPVVPPVTPPAPAPTPAPEWQSRIASLQLDLQASTERIEQMKREYASMEMARDRAASAGGQEQLEKLLRKLCGPLSNLVVLAAAARAGKDVAAADMAVVVADVEKQLSAAGLLVIGQPGEASAFDVAQHQRMSGGDVHTGTPVVVRIPGYKLGEKVLQKALVTSKEP